MKKYEILQGEPTASRELRNASPSFSAFLDISRGLAASAVFLEHLRAALFHGYPQLPPMARTMFVRAWYFIGGFGFEAVVVFFVLSGYLVGGLGVGKIMAGTFSLRRYVLNRTTRLFLVFLPGLILTVVFDNLGARFTDAGFWTADNPILLEKFSDQFIAGDTPARFLCNAAMLQSFSCPMLGSNMPLWTLSYEFWFYVTFGLACTFILREGAVRWVAASIGVLLLWFLGYKFAFMLAIWCLGLGVYLYEGTFLRRPILSALCFCMAASLSRIINAGEPKGGVQDVVVVLEGVAFAWVLISVRSLRLRPVLAVRKIAATLAGFSYTLYLVHFPTMLLMIAILSEVMGIDPRAGLTPNTLRGFAIYLLFFVLVMSFAWLFASLTEARTATVRSRFASFFRC